MSFESDLLVGHAELIAAAGLGTWNPSGAYTTSQTAIVLDALPETLPRLIALSAYPVDEGVAENIDQIGLQILTRWDGDHPNGVRDLDSAIFDLLQGRSQYTVAGIRVISCWRTSGASLGQDASRRWSRTSTYYVTVVRPSPHRL